MSEEVEVAESDATSRDYVIESDVTSQTEERLSGCQKSTRLVRT